MVLADDPRVAVSRTERLGMQFIKTALHVADPDRGRARRRPDRIFMQSSARPEDPHMPRTGRAARTPRAIASGVPAEADREIFHKASPRKRARMTPIGLTHLPHIAVGCRPRQAELTLPMCGNLPAELLKRCSGRADVLATRTRLL